MIVASPFRTDALFLARTFAQMLAVSLLVCAAVLVVNGLSFRSRWNWLWVLGIPFAVAHSFNRNGQISAITGFCLVPWSLLSLFIGIALFTVEP